VNSTQADQRHTGVIEVVSFVERHLTGVIDVILPIQQAEFGVPVTLERNLICTTFALSTSMAKAISGSH
jgi:hypothetical protein